MKNTLEPEDIEFKFIKSLATKNFHHSISRNEEFGIQLEQISKKRNDESFSKPKSYYYIDGVDKEYTDLDELCRDWNEIKNFDDPNNEIQWVKVIRKKR